MRVREMRRRLQVLERLFEFRPPPSPCEQIQTLALGHMSGEDLELMLNMVSDRGGSVRRTPLQHESALLAVWEAALETEARRMGFESFAEAERGRPR